MRMDLRETSKLFSDAAAALVKPPYGKSEGIEGYCSPQMMWPVRELRVAMLKVLPDNLEKVECLCKLDRIVKGGRLDDVMRGLLEAKDCAVRAHLFNKEPSVT